ncbi:FtsK/SpoIIIE domain-containing protein [Anoxybacillus sp. ST4]|uniref:FtsK/SpoIIIE domain-containing protein n=1 Tax=Anoxybacillus sp. ST4 TaxID=2864181 RepID=UPI001C64250F|nr:FtsK/SpoIIIE domain-containing protein [Anoxybacillus sp. ST4]MBW7649780.1 AAA family ATPase [Anoxybacillus sp. ST4]
MFEWLKKQYAKSTLIKCFRAAELYQTYKTGEKAIYIYPKIHSVQFKINKTIYTFTLQNGMNPKDVKKKEYVFQQIFGKQIEIDGDVKKFTLTVYHDSLDHEVLYDYQAFYDVIAKMKLPIIAGKDKNGQWRAFDMTKHPHLLIAGETGSGKSTQLRSILTTLIQYKKPDELELYLADCKKSEFHIFKQIEHVKCVLSSPRDIRKMLQYIKQELDERSNLTDEFGVAHIDDLPDSHKKPYIIVCIDEFVMLRNDSKIMDILIEIVAIGRTLGVFTILSMQRPTADVLDTTIRANLTVRMGFKVADATNAKIINTIGAEKIEQAGQFILRIVKQEEIQAPYLDIEKAKKILESYVVEKEVKEIKDEPKRPSQMKNIPTFLQPVQENIEWFGVDDDERS